MLKQGWLVLSRFFGQEVEFVVPAGTYETPVTIRVRPQRMSLRRNCVKLECLAPKYVNISRVDRKEAGSGSGN